MVDSDAPKGKRKSPREKKLKKDFLTVGIGASAGGIRALKEFFAKMPADSGMAFVVVLHLSQTHESNLAKILQNETEMPVTQVTETTPIQPNRVYVIPPAQGLEMVDGVVRLTKPQRVRGQRIAIDNFFRSLATAYKESAVGIVLSGAGDDGTLGVKRIKEENGFTIVQKPEDAEYEQMPLNAIRTGLVDWILPVERMPEKLLSLRKSTEELNLTDSDDGNLAPELKDSNALRDILTILRVRTGHDFSNYKRATLLRRIARHLQIYELDDLQEYVGVLREKSDEADFLLKNLLINVTNFFRDRQAWDVLEQDVVPRLFAGKTAEDQVRVWVAGSATGEEAYSIGILLIEYASRFNDSPKIQIFASDVDEDAIAQAREGIYPEGISEDVSPERLKRFFVREGKNYRIKKELREKILFAPHNILRDPPFSRLDLIACRNVLIYLNRETQERLMQLFHFALLPNGFLFLGSSESADNLPLLFSPLDKKMRVYVRRPTNPVAQPPVTMPIHGKWEAKTIPVLPYIGGQTFSLNELHFHLLEKLSPPSVLVNEDYEIVHLSETAGRYLRFVGGEPTSNLVKVVVPDLQTDLRTALFTAVQEKRTVESRRTRVNINGEERLADLTIHPIEAPDGSGNFFLVIFDEYALAEIADEKTEPAKAKAADVNRGAAGLLARHLEEELQRTKDRLRVTVEQYDTSIEELKAANEELQAINEELRSATEELETSKEELQSVNEELTTVNHELKEKIDEVSSANSDLQNFMASTQIATIILDRNLHIKRFTPPAREIFNIIFTDIGRPLEHLTNKLNFINFTEDIHEVLRTLVKIEREVRNDKGQEFLLRLLPYRTVDDRIDGVVLTFIDVTERKKAEEAMRESEERLRQIMDGTEDYAILTLDHEGIITSWNTGAEKMFGYTRDEAIGSNTEIIFTPEDRAKEEQIIEMQKAREKGRAEDERYHIRKDGTRFYVSGVMMKLHDDGKYAFAKIARDLTERKRFEDALKEADRKKDEFLATLAHELRNPLAPIRSGLEIVRRASSDKESRMEALGIIERQTNQMVRLVDDLLDISRITQGKIKLRIKRMNLKRAVEMAIEGSREMLDKAGHELVVSFPKNDVCIDGDLTRVTQIFQNVLNNAGKYTPPGGKIWLSIKKKKGEAIAIVRDTGIGIPPGMLSKIFNMFSQVENVSEHARSGLGIGLSVVKRLVEMHGGAIEARSEGTGKGSEFILHFPLVEDDGQPVGKESNETLTKYPKSNAPEPEKEAAESPDSKKYKILVVDDNADAAQMLEILLSMENHVVKTAYDAESGLREARDFQPDVCLLDIGLPGMSGYEAARRLREFLPDSLLISISGWGQEEDRRRSRESGFDYHLVKPVEIEDINKLLKESKA